MPDVMARYDDDLFLWSQQQAAVLREAAAQGVNLPVDWENVAEEIESLGKSDRRGIVNRLATVVLHLLKLEHSPASDPRRGWIRTVERARDDLADLLKDSPSLRAKLPDLLKQASERALGDAETALEEAGEYDAARAVARLGVRYSADDVLGDWLPGDDGRRR